VNLKAQVGRIANDNDPKFAVGSVKYDNDYGGLDRAAVGYAGNQSRLVSNNKSLVVNNIGQDDGYNNNRFGL
jgi:hypothetical protein